MIFVSSSGMYGRRLHGDEPQYLRGTYRGLTACARTKRMQVVLAEEWARAWRATGSSCTPRIRAGRRPRV
ncbi:hypothetical protein [Actinophytocola sp.]|uniref:hypothetical protein n=1 Tax=Actinophytocola sp. TaxID=1872138 RepID=UPI003D6B3425